MAEVGRIQFGSDVNDLRHRTERFVTRLDKAVVITGDEYLRKGRELAEAKRALASLSLVAGQMAEALKVILNHPEIPWLDLHETAQDAFEQGDEALAAWRAVRQSRATEEKVMADIRERAAEALVQHEREFHARGGNTTVETWVREYDREAVRAVLDAAGFDALSAVAGQMAEALRPLNVLKARADFLRHEPGSTCTWKLSYDELAAAAEALAGWRALNEEENDGR